MRFPIIAFKENNNMIYYLEKRSDLFHTTEKLLKNNVFKNSFFVDSDGKTYQPSTIKKIRYIGFFGYNPLLKNWWNDREIEIDIEFKSNINQIELNLLKDNLVEKVYKSKSFWNKSWDLNELKGNILNSNTYLQLILLFK